MSSNNALKVPAKEFSHTSNDELSVLGFDNLKLNCWLNSILQSLMSCTGFNKCVTDNVLQLINDPVAISYMQILTGNHSQASHIRDQMMDIFATIQLQKCAFDGMMKFLDRLSKSCSRIDELFKCVQKIETSCPKCNSKTIRYEENSFIQRTTSQNDFVADLCKHDVMLTDYTCNQCNTKSDITRTEKVVHFGEIVTIITDKSQQMGNFPDHFTIVSHDGKCKYILVAIIDHYGDYSGGHYTARVLRHEGWVHCNDKTITQSSPNPTGSESILLYELSEH